jgi:hypothetical protein
MQFLILILGTASITWLVTSTDGPYNVFSNARDKYEYHGLLSALSCPWCFAVWVSTALHFIAMFSGDLLLDPFYAVCSVFGVAFAAGTLCWLLATIDDAMHRG